MLDSARPRHRLAEELVAKVREEAADILDSARRSGALGWDDFAVGWWRIVRRVVLGDGARDDHTVTDLLARLRRDANWAYLKPKRTGLRDRFLQRLDEHVFRAEPGSLAAIVASLPAESATDPVGQVPHWLFAFDAAGMNSFRALGLLDVHPHESDRAYRELAQSDLSRPDELPFLRACVLESLRLWPTTPAILRETTTETTWESGALPAKSALLIFVPYFHRDPLRLPYADSFTPDSWLDGNTAGDWPLIPFSAGPAECPGRNLVLLVTSALLAALTEHHRLRQLQPRPLDASAPLPAAFSPFRLRFELAPRHEPLLG